MAENQLICPVDGVPINETKVRVVAFLVLLIAVLYGLTRLIWLPVLLAADFGLRGFNAGRYSPLGIAADWLVKRLRLPAKPTDQAPKRFAARIGLAFGVVITILHGLGNPALIPTSILALFASLESGAGFCAGCYVYTYYTRWFVSRSITS